MIQIHITLPLAYGEADIRRAIFDTLPTLRSEELYSYRLRSLAPDTAKKPTVSYKARAILEVEPSREKGLLKMKKLVSLYVEPTLVIPKVASGPRLRPVVVGFGPAGIFCALTLAMAGLRPLVLELGKPVDERARDVRRFMEQGILDPSSNIQFGEGGAGAFSDGKLKYGTLTPEVNFVLTELVAAGAPEEILVLKAPHIGTDNLPLAVRALREKIISLGGEIRFGARLDEIYFCEGRVSALRIRSREGEEILPCDTLFLASGHSARDLFYMLEEKGVSMEARPFGMGVRIEHKQADINRQIYGDADLPLPPASYHLVTHLESGRSVYSFCMCPGGSVVAATSMPDAVVTNGMSPYLRDGENANSALLVSLFPEDFEGERPTRGVAFQEEIERRAFALAGGAYRAPAIRLGDFMKGGAKGAPDTVKPTYERGIALTSFDALFPSYITASLREALVDFDAHQRGFLCEDAILTAPETRSTSPVRILRDSSGVSVSHKGLYPTGEGAGYSGGILSSAVDGIKQALSYIDTV